MRICLLANASNNHTVRWAKLLAKSGHEVLLLSDQPAKGHIYGVRVETPKMDVATRFVAFKVMNPEFGNNKLKYRAYLKPMEAFAPDIVHAMEALGYGPILPHWDGCARVLMPWGSDMLVWPRRPGPARDLVESAIKGADALTANAPGMETEMFGDMTARPAAMKLFAWGCDTVTFGRGDSSARTDARRVLGLALEPRIILSPRNASKALGAEMIVEAWRVRRHQKPGAGEILVVMRGSATDGDWKAVEDLVAKSGHAATIRLEAGYLDSQSMATWFRASDAFISFPETDFFAVTIMEGMASGSLPILAPLPAYREPMEDIPANRDAYGAIFAKERSVPGLVEALERWGTLGAGADRAVREFNAERAARLGNFEKNATQLDDVYYMAQAEFAKRLRR